MSSANHIDQLTSILGACLESLDALGFAAAAAYIDSAIKLLPRKQDAAEANPGNIMFYSFGDDKYYEELDNLVGEYFGESCLS